MLGLPQGRVRLADYDESWPEAFARERDRVAAALGALATGIEHIGSTAVVGMRSKPLIDVMVGLARIEDHAPCVPKLEAIGYAYKGEFGLPGRHFFVLGDPTTFHVHIVVKGAHFWRLNLHFRDLLRSNPKAARDYLMEKERLALEHAESREQYTAGKDATIRRLLAESGWTDE
jgi:GrpB-like predicted nucleotidyltransferase (UPF0157 family)